MSPRRVPKAVPASTPTATSKHAPTPHEWTLRPASKAAQRQWEAAKAAEPELLAGVRERLRTRPLDRSDNPARIHRLKPPFHEHVVGDAKLPQWQYEISAAGRIWFCPDPTTHTIWVTRVSLQPPKETHRR